MKTSTGFSLVEMAMVLLIVSLLIGGLLTPLSGQMTQQQIKQTNATLQEMKEALVGFAITQGRLPCPDYPPFLPPTPIPSYIDGLDGLEDREPEDDIKKRCEKGEEGFLPWATLGVEREDAWGNSFRYRVISGYAAYVTPPPLDKFTQSDGKLKDELKSKLEIQDVNGNLLSLKHTNDDTHIVAIIFSYGKDGQPYSENDGTDLIYVEDSYVENRFDDILVRISSNTLFNRLVASGRYW